MKVFVVIGYHVQEFVAIEAALAALYPNATYKLRDGVWLVRTAEATSKEVSDRLKITPSAEVANGMVVGMNGYFGRWRPDVWEWLSAPTVAANG